VTWSVRTAAELNDDLTALYRLPVNVAAKAGALALIAAAFDRGDFAMAAIAAGQMRLPDPPPLLKRAESTDDIARRASALRRVGLLKADPDWDAKHPRTGTKPNPGWFALKPKPSVPSVGQRPQTSVPSIKPRKGWPLPKVNAAARAFIKEIAPRLALRYGLGLLLGAPEIDLIVKLFLAVFTPLDLNGGEALLTAQLKAALQPFPKSLEELQQQPIENALGYEPHHIVGQSDDNLAKRFLSKFGSDKIDDPNNIVWIPRFLHEEISAYCSSSSDGPGTPLVRDAINKMDFDEQRQEGLRIMRELGILK
jgi:hypothetical protein